MKWVEIQTPKTAAELFEPLAQNPHSFFLDSSSEGHYSFLGAFPYKIVSSLEDIEKELNECSDIKKNLPSPLTSIPFLGGAVGFMSYEAVRQWESHLGPAKPEPFHIPDILFGFYDTFFVVDHSQNKTFLISLELTPQSLNHFNYLQEIAESNVAPLERCSTEIKRSAASHSGEHLSKESCLLSAISCS